MIVGIGIDIVEIPRFEATIARQPGMVDRLFTQREQFTDEGNRRTATSLAARFAAKEAVAKALGVPAGMQWHHCEVIAGMSGRPHLHLSETVKNQAEAQGVTSWHLSLSHDGDLAVAYVIAEAN